MAPYEIDEYGNVIYVPSGSSRPSTPSYVSGGGMSTLPPSTSTAITADDTIGGWGSSTSKPSTPTVVASIPTSIVEANRYYQTQPAPTPTTPSGRYGITPDPFEEEIFRPKPSTPPSTSTAPSTPTVVATIPRERVEANRYYQTQPAPTTSMSETPARTTTSSSTSTTTTTTTTAKTEEKKSGGFLDNLFKPIRDWLNSIGLTGEPVDTNKLFLDEIESYYSEIESIMKEIPDSFYKADGGYKGLKTKKEFLDHAWQLKWESELDSHGNSLGLNSMRLERMRDYAKKLQEKWKKAQQQLVEKAVQAGVVDVGVKPEPAPEERKPTIAEEDKKPPQSTNYMVYGFIGVIAILVVVIIIVLLRR